MKKLNERGNKTEENDCLPGSHIQESSNGINKVTETLTETISHKTSHSGKVI